MPALPSDDIDIVHTQMMQEFSELRLEVPINKSQLRSGIVIGDGVLDSAEASFVAAIPAGPIHDWVMANPHIGRRMFELIEKHRREVL